MIDNLFLENFLASKSDVFSFFGKDVIQDIVLSSNLNIFENNEAIVNSGEPLKCLSVLISGAAQVLSMQNDGTSLALSQLSPGDVFGEVAVLTGDHAIADVIAMDRCYVLEIPMEIFNSHILVNPQAIHFLSKLLTQKVKNLTTAKTSQHVKHTQNTYSLNLKNDIQAKIISLDFGQKRIRFGIFDTQDENLTVRGSVELASEEKALITIEAGGKTFNRTRPAFNSKGFFQVLFESMDLLENKYLFTPFDVVVVGHRVIHGGSFFSEAAVIKGDVLEKIEKASCFAPEHNCFNLNGIKLSQAFFKDSMHVAVFDTAFHQTLPVYAHMYGLPYRFYEEQGIRKYGFHGPSHRYASFKAAQLTEKPIGQMRTISCHLGVGTSLCAIDHGRSIDTSMGLSPVDGIIMPSRSGRIDPSVMTFLRRNLPLDDNEIDRLINLESGLAGVSGIAGGNIFDIEEAAQKGNQQALLAHRIYCYQIRKEVGSYWAAMEGVDTLVFTGSIGENSSLVRSLVCQGLNCFGVKIDEQKNQSFSIHEEAQLISKVDSSVQVLVVRSNDEKLVAWEALQALERNQITLSFKENSSKPILVEISAHHVHLTQEHVEQLFGKGHQLTPKSQLSQPGQYACEEQVDLIGPKGEVKKVRVLGPTRSITQVEIAMTEQFKLGITPPIRQSGDIDGTPGIVLRGSHAEVTLNKGVICAHRHIHMSPEDAMHFRVRDKYTVSVKIEGDRELEFGDVTIRVHPDFRLAMHIDTDEGNAANVKTGAKGYITHIQSRG